ncbi:MAG: hypothetical protein WDZ43_00615 [Nitrosopumilaceae archaeon]
MKKPLLFLVMGGFLVAIGIGLSVYATQLVIENLTTQEGFIGGGMTMEVYKELNPAKNENGVYVIQIDDFQSVGGIIISVFDPLGNVVITKSIDSNPIQDGFKISMAGTYKLLVESSVDSEVHVIAVIGYLPQDQSLTVSIFGFVVILVGLVGLVVGTLYFIKSRGKPNVS